MTRWQSTSRVRDFYMRGCEMKDIFYNKTVTVYSKTAEGVEGTETWYPTVLKNVRMLVSRGADTSKNGTDSADSAKLYVKPGMLPEGSKGYLPEKEWGRLPQKCKQYFYTFKSGESFFVEGDTTREEQREDFFGYMKERYDNCFMVTNVDRYDLIPHLEVGGA